MTGAPLDCLAEAYGVQRRYVDASRHTHEASDATVRAVLTAMGVAANDSAAVARSLAAAPAPPIDPAIVAPADARCFMPAWLETGRGWGVTCQLYGLRSARNHGIGDFEDLADLADRVAAQGGDFIGVNPVHALFTADPERCSPFSPSNRRRLNPLYIALDRVPGVAMLPPIDDAECSRARDGEEIDYAAVAALKLGALRALWRRLGERPNLWQAAARADFEAFVEKGGVTLRDHALFEALSHRMVAAGRSAGWHGWPDEFRDVRGSAVSAFAQENEDAIRFHLWLQWIADTQLARAQARARAAGMRIGLYLDLAAGTAPDGSATWSDPALVVTGATIGAPPDPFFTGGQNWGLAPMSPAAIRSRGFEPFRDMLDTVTRHAGAVRIDHAMGLHRLYWIPHGMGAREGCYVLYPMAGMVRALADVSVSREAVVIGEDLGTVPKGFPEAMQAAGILSSRVLFFQWVRGNFRAAASYPRDAFISVSTHDLPPLAAWWRGGDVALFETLGLMGSTAVKSAIKQRRHDRRALVDRILKDLPKTRLPKSLVVRHRATGDDLAPDVAAAVHAFLARTPSRLFGVQFEDLCGADRPVNVPGTWKEYPNWRLRAPATVEAATAGALWAGILAAVAHERPR